MALLIVTSLFFYNLGTKIHSSANPMAASNALGQSSITSSPAQSALEPLKTFKAIQKFIAPDFNEIPDDKFGESVRREKNI